MKKLEDGCLVLSRIMEKDVLKGFLIAHTSGSVERVSLDIIKAAGYKIPYLNASYDEQFGTLVGVDGESLTSYPVINSDFVLTSKGGIIVLATILDRNTKKPVGVVAYNGTGRAFNLTYKSLEELTRKNTCCNFNMVVDKDYGLIAVKKNGEYFGTIEMTIPDTTAAKERKNNPIATQTDNTEIPVVQVYSLDSLKSNEFNQPCQDKLVRTMMNMQALTPYYYTVLQAIKRLPAPGLGTLGVTQDTLYYDLKFVAELGIPELTFVLIHEIMHIAMQHSARFGNRTNHDLWNIATDLYINSIICSDFGCKFGAPAVNIGTGSSPVEIKTPNFGIYMETIGETIDLGCDTPESIYNKLLKENPNYGMSGGSSGQPQQGSQGQGSSQQSLQQGIKNIQNGANKAQQQINQNGSPQQRQQGQQANQQVQQGCQQMQQGLQNGNMQQVQQGLQQAMQGCQQLGNIMNQIAQQQRQQQMQQGASQLQQGANQAQQACNNSPQSQQANQQIQQGIQQAQQGMQNGNSSQVQQGMNQIQQGIQNMQNALQQSGQQGSQSGQQSSQNMQQGANQMQNAMQGQSQGQQGMQGQGMQGQGMQGQGMQGQGMQGQGMQGQGMQGGSSSSSGMTSASNQMQAGVNQAQNALNGTQSSNGQFGESIDSGSVGGDLASGGDDGSAGQLKEVNVIYNGKKLTGSVMKDVMSNRHNKSDTNEQANLEDSRRALQKIATKIKMEEEALGEPLSKNAGNGCSLVQRYIEFGLSTGVDWRVLVKNMCKDKPKKTFTLANPNVDYMNMGMTIADRRPIGKPTHISHVKFAVDVSGSVSQKELQVILSEINNIFTHFKVDGELIYWSTEIGDVGMFSSLKDMLKVKPISTGGTDVKCVFQYLNGELSVNGKAESDKVKDIKGVFIITDGYFSMNFKEYEKAFGRRVVWLITGAKGNPITFNPPFGKVIGVDID